MKTTDDRHLCLLVQEALKSRGHDPGPLDGLWGGRTERAWVAFRGTFLFPAAPKDGPVVLAPGEPPWMRIARAELGVEEIAGERDNPRIVEYHQACTLRATDDETPWCSSFVNWSLAQCGLAGTRNAMARSFIAWGRDVERPSPGCIAIFRRGAPPAGHVAFVLDVTPEWIRVLGGNQGDRVSIADFRRETLIGCRWPAATGGSSAPPTP